MDIKKRGLIKKSCVAVGLTLKDSVTPYILVGSGFMIDENGFFITAAHVTEGLYNMYEKLKKKGIHTNARIFLATETETSSQLISIKIGLGYEIPNAIYFPDNGSESFELSLDMYVGKVQGHDKYDFLRFDKPTKITPFDKVVMCGYPMVSQSVIVDSKKDMRWSPLVQPGVISSLLPTDASPTPYGIQTDIIGTAGSSGSPIIDYESGQVVGIAQKVLTAEISNSDETAKIGLTYGISNFFVTNDIPNIKKKIYEETDEEGKPKKHLIQDSKFVMNKHHDSFSNVYRQ